MIFGVFQKNWVLGYSWSTLLWYWCYSPHRSRDALSPVRGIFIFILANLILYFWCCVTWYLLSQQERDNILRSHVLYISITPPYKSPYSHHVSIYTKRDNLYNPIDILYMAFLFMKIILVFFKNNQNLNFHWLSKENLIMCIE